MSFTAELFLPRGVGGYLFESYDQLLFKRAQGEFPLPPPTGHDLKHTAKPSKKSAAGLDQWAIKDVALFSDEAYRLLAAMLTTIMAACSLKCVFLRNTAALMWLILLRLNRHHFKT